MRTWHFHTQSATDRLRVARPGQLSRRLALRVGVTGAVTAAGGTILAGLGPWGAGTAAATRAAGGKIVLTLLPAQTFYSAIGPNLWSILHNYLRPFLDQHPGVEVTLFSNQGYQGATQAAMLAGVGPDVFSDWVAPPFIQNDMLLDLGPYVRRDNISTDGFFQGEMQFFREAGLFSPSNPNGLYALPAYLNNHVYAVNLGTLDQLGLKYPEPDWTVGQWTSLWQSVTVKGSKPRYGASSSQGGYDYSGGMITPFLLHGFGGEYVTPGQPDKSYLSSPGSLACGEWYYPLVWDGVISGSGSFANGTLVCDAGSTGTDGGQQYDATQFRGLKWDYFVNPVWPVRRSAFAASDFFAIWSGSKQPELSWQLLKWLAVGPDWQRLLVRVGMVGPNQPALWPEWADVVRQVAPPLRDKNLEAFVTTAQSQEPYFGQVFRYAEPQSKAVVVKYGGLLANRKIGVRDAFQRMTAEINAAQTAGVAEAAAARRIHAAFAREVGIAEATASAVAVPAPARTGVGLPPTNAPSLASHKAAAGSWRLTGVGGGMYGKNDSMTFAGQAYAKSRGVFSCRLLSVAAAHGTGIADGARVGLAARSDLTDSAGEVAVNVSMGRGVHLLTRPIPGSPGADTKPLNHDLSVEGVPVLATSDSQAMANYLLHPVWFRLVVAVDHWTAYTSLDGRSWTQQFSPVGVDFLGAWVGLFATAHGGNPLEVVFDQLAGFQPDVVVQVGSA